MNDRITFYEESGQRDFGLRRIRRANVNAYALITRCMYIYMTELRNIVTIKHSVFRYYDPNAKKRVASCIT